jgi:hypothetical protein
MCVMSQQSTTNNAACPLAQKAGGCAVPDVKSPALATGPQGAGGRHAGAVKHLMNACNTRLLCCLL